MCNDTQNSKLSGMRRLIATAIAGMVSVISSLFLKDVIQVYLIETYEMSPRSSTAFGHEREPGQEPHLSAVVCLLIFNIYSISTYSFSFLRRKDQWKNPIVACFFVVSVVAACLRTAALGDSKNSLAYTIATAPLLLPLGLWFSAITHSMWDRWSMRPGDGKAPR
ncbi:uncharacterized protein BDZ83DRAFT_350475 [Colletotrichum acutatum]|uniref:Uncharacterized protein n=1 Tax=Glomerella acutata TaxID=27357 RepID=A0AAD8UKJ2_GLOAC|nr:uncharacterized protein BDZ83DRAFT_350475 [Colletotrichum acutatum]KAK1724492.1 hypothetical protein BDZ83DRAFT_350475 [Colletotrichum acutatum]